MSHVSNAPGPVSFFFSLKSKITLLVLVPSLILALVTIGSQRFLEHVGQQAIADLTQSQTESRKLSSASRSIRTKVTAFTQNLTHYLDQHQKTLLSTEPPTHTIGIMGLKTQTTALEAVATQALDPMRRSFSRGVEANLADKDVLRSFDKHYSYIIRTAQNLSRLFDIFKDSHDRTVEHIARNEFDRARSQYVYEEQARARALLLAAEQLTGVLDRLAVNVEGYIALKSSGAISRAQSDAGRAMSMTFWWIAVTIVLATSLSVFVITLTVSKPIGSIIFAVRRLAKGNLDVEIRNLVRRDEIGEAARALDVLKVEAKERHQIESDLANYRDHLEQLVEQRTQEIERQRTQIEEALAKERELNGLQRQFVAMVSHEFRTPLSIVDGNAQRLLKRLDTVSKDRLENALKTIRLSVRRLVDLMESVLSAARLENGQIQIDPKPCSLIDLIKELSDSYLDIHPDHQIHLDIDGLPELIIADEKLIRQVVSNLISNAIKYAPGTSQIWIGGTIDENGCATVSVRDEGLGIPLSDQDKLFERFFRASTSTGIAGTGIGLNLSAHLVQMHGGKIDFVSSEGVGTTFFVRLPISSRSTEECGQEECGDDIYKSINKQAMAS